jgi:hypothetical protein
MKSQYREHSVATEGARFAESRLRVGNTLARSVLARYVVSEATCTTYLPADTASTSLLEFTDGGVAESEHPTRWIAEKIQTYLAADGDRIVVFEDAVARRGDPVLEMLESRIRYLDQEVFHILYATDANWHAVETTISESDSPHQLVGVFTHRIANAQEAGEPRDISGAEIDEWSQKAEAVVVSAYDAEGFIFCTDLKPR